MKLPGIDGGSGLAPAMEGLLVTRRERAPRPLPRRERLSEGLLAAQVVVDLAVSTVREWAALGVSPRLQAAVLVRVYAVDALLTPIGVLAAAATVDNDYYALIVLPLIGLMAIFAQER